MRAHFDADLIAELKRRVVAHNEGTPAEAARLGDLRKVYERGFRGSNPGHRAMKRVDEHLARLAKAEFDETDHPRDGGGEFTSKGSGATRVRVDLPRTDQEHVREQERSAGYRALTSDAIPENRFGAAGGVLRDAGSIAAGAAIIHTLNKNPKNGLVTRAAGRLAGNVSGLAAGATTAVAANGVRAATINANRVIGKIPAVKLPMMPKMTVPKLPVMSQETAIKARRSASAAGAKFGRTVGRKATQLTGNLVQSAIRTAGNGPVTQRATQRSERVLTRLLGQGVDVEKATARATRAGALLDRGIKRNRKAAVFAALAGTTAMFIRNQVKDTMLDPASYGREIDGLSHRIINKVADSADLKQAHGAMLGELRKDLGHAGSIESLSAWLTADGGEGLAKAVVPWGAEFRNLLTGASALGGAAVGAGTAFLAGRATGLTGHKGNPYRDKDGKFTSKDKAVTGIGGLLGGAAAGLAVFAALRRHNTKVVPHQAKKLFDAIRTQSAKIENGSARQVKAFLKTEVDRKKKLLDTQTGAIRKKLKELDDHEGSSRTALEAKMMAVHHDRIATVLAMHPDVQLPGKDGKFVPIMDLAEDVPGFHRLSTDERMRTRLRLARDAVARLDRKGLQQVVKDLPEGVQKEVLDTHADMLTRVKGVAAQIAGHQGNIDTAIEAKKAAEAAVDARVAEHSAAEAAAKVATADEQPAANEALKAAAKARDDARKHFTKVNDALDKLRASPKGVDDPFTGKPLVPPTAAEVRAQRDELTRKATKSVDEKWKAEVEAFKKQQLEELSARESRLLTHVATSADKYGSPEYVQANVKHIADLDAKVRAASNRVTDAKIALAPAQRDFEDLQALRKAKTKTGLPKGMTPERAKQLRDTEKQIEDRHVELVGNLEREQTAHHQAAAELIQHTTVLKTLLQTGAPQVARKSNPLGLSPKLRGDLKRASATVKGPIGEFMRRPTIENLKVYVKTLPEKGKGIYDTASVGFKDGVERTWKDLTWRDPGDGHGARFSTGKAIRNAALGVGAAQAVYEDGGTLFNRAFGDDEKKTEARKKGLNIKWEDVPDPMTGGGFTTLSMPDPNKPGERVVLWGERQDTETSRVIPVRAGANMKQTTSRLKQHFENLAANKNGNGNGGNSEHHNPELEFDKPEHKQAVDAALKAIRSEGKQQTIEINHGGVPHLRFRQEDAKRSKEAKVDDLENAANLVANAVRKKMGDGKLRGEDLHKALGALFSRQGGAFTTKQAFRFLTGADPDGTVRDSVKSPLMKPEGLRSNDKAAVASALTSEIDRIINDSKPTTVAERSNLHRMVALVQTAKGLSADSVKGLHEKIGKLEVASRASTFQEAKPQAAPAAPAGLGEPVNADDRSEWARNDHIISPHATTYGNRVADAMGLERRADRNLIVSAVNSTARNVWSAYRKTDEGLTEEEAFKITHAAINRALAQASGAQDKYELAAKLFPKDGKGPFRSPEFLGELATAHIAMKEARPKDNNKSADSAFDDLETLMKASFGEFLSDLHPRAPAGSAGAGEFVAGGHGSMSSGQRLATEGVEAASKTATGGNEPPHEGQPRPRSRPQAWNHPVRAGNEIGGQLGYETAFSLANSFLPPQFKALTRFTRFATTMAAGQAGSYLGAAAGDAYGQHRLAAQGKAPEAYHPPTSKGGLGETLAELAGNVAGSTVGGSAGAAVGSTAGRYIGGAIGSLAGPGGAVAGVFAGGMAGGFLGRVAGGALAGYAGDLGAKTIYDRYAKTNGRQAADESVAEAGAAGAAGYGTYKVLGRTSAGKGLARHFGAFDQAAAGRVLARFTQR